MRARRAESRDARARARATRKSLKTYILGNYGTEAVEMLADFGMSAPKVANQATVEAKAKAVAQSKATRKARHTMSKKQKSLIKGVVEGAAQTETSASAASAASHA